MRFHPLLLFILVTDTNALRSVDLYARRIQLDTSVARDRDYADLQSVANIIVSDYETLIDEGYKDLPKSFQYIFFSYLCKQSDSETCRKFSSPEARVRALLGVRKLLSHSHMFKPPADIHEVCGPRNSVTRKPIMDKFDVYRAECVAHKTNLFSDSTMCVQEEPTQLDLKDLGIISVSNSDVVVDDTSEHWNMYSYLHRDFSVITSDKDFCTQRAALHVLTTIGNNGLPAFFDLAPSSSISDSCKTRMLIVEKVGYEAWTDIEMEPPLAQFALAAQLFEIVRNLHSQGFLYGSFDSLENVRFDSGLEFGSVYLANVRNLRRSVIGEQNDEFRKLERFIPNVEYLRFAFRDAIDIGSSECPLYDVWIEILRQLSRGVDDHTITEYLISQYAPLMANRDAALIAGSLPSRPILQFVKFPSVLRPNPPDEFILPVSPEIKFQAKITSMISAQLETDLAHPQSRPYLLYDAELAPMGEAQVVFRISGFLSKKSDVTVFATSEPAGYVIKYQTNCAWLNRQMLDLQRDFGFQKYIQDQVRDIRISPKVVWLSPPIRFAKYKTPKNNFERSDTETCSANERAHIRYMIMERAVTDMFGLIRDTSLKPLQRLRLGIKVGIDVISRLKRIHKLGIVHGDVHPGNVVQLNSPSDGTDPEYGFIDFGLSFFDAEMTDRECEAAVDGTRGCETVHDWSLHNICYLSFWNLKYGSRIAYRDDVFNALMVASFVMNGQSQFKYCADSSQHSMDEHIRWKSELFIFGNAIDLALPPSHREVVEVVRGAMQNVLDETRGVLLIDDLPNYEAILSSLKTARDYIAQFDDSISVVEE
jgi:hypothetical protein